MRTPLLMLAALMLAPAVFAGQPLQVLAPDDGVIQTTADDKARVVNLRWPSQTDVRFWLAENEFNGDVVLPAFNLPPIGNNLQRGQIVDAVNRAVQTWNGARWGSFQFEEFVPTTRFFPPVGLLNYVPRRPRIDGYNLITFMDTETQVTGAVGVTLITYMRRPWNPSEELGRPNTPLDLIHVIEFGAEEPTFILTADFDGDGNPDMFLPSLDTFQPGEIIDADIVIDADTSVPYLRTWPADEGDLTAGDASLVPGSIDIQALLTFHLGQARGISNSMLIDSSMFFFFAGPFSDAPFLEDPYRRRVLAFDDEMAVGLSDGSDFDLGSLGVISGQVLEGSRFDGSGLGDDAAAAAVDEVVVQAPVFLLARPETIAESDILSSGRPAIPAGSGADDIISNPLVEDTETAGIWRRIAHVLTGQNLALSAGPGSDFFIVLPDPEGIDVGTDPAEQPGGPDGAAIPEDQAINVGDVLNSIYYFPGLPPTTDDGTTITYAVRLQNDLNGIESNPVYLAFLASRPEAFPDEFYGGSLVQLDAGNGLTAEAISTVDNNFGNGYLTAQIDNIGRLAARIVGGTDILAGMDRGPESYIQVISSRGLFSNQVASIGNPIAGVQINDTLGEMTATWERANDFRLRMDVTITEQGGITGIPHGLRVAYTLTNRGTQAATYSMRQILDAYLFGSENPIYTIDSGPLDRAVTLSGTGVPSELRYQTSSVSPSFTAFVTLRGLGLVTPGSVTVAGVNDLSRVFSGDGGYFIRGFNPEVSDTGIGLRWDNITLESEEGRTISFIVGFLPPGQVRDAWIELATLPDETAGEFLTGVEDDPAVIEPVDFSEGLFRDDVNIITNTGAADAAGAGQVGGSLVFRLVENGFPNTALVQTVGALADVDLDGDLDVIAAGVPGGDDPVASAIHRLYENRQRINSSGTVEYFYQDVTFGPDGIPGTADDRMPSRVPDFPGMYCVGMAAADFNLDGDIDLFFANRNGPNQFFVNTGFPGGLDAAGSFVDRSYHVEPGANPSTEPAFRGNWLPGLLNRGRPNNDGSIIEGGMLNPLTWDFSSRVVVGDIDGDGDQDIIISCLEPFDDVRYGNDGPPAPNASVVWIDASPRNDDFDNGDNRPHTANDLFSDGLMWSERVLINMTNVPAYRLTEFSDGTTNRGHYFVDDTLGADERAGVLSDFFHQDDGELRYNGQPLQSQLDNPEVVRLIGDRLDRMPPVFPNLYSTAQYSTDTELIEDLEDGLIDLTVEFTPMSSSAIQPMLGPIFEDGALDLISIRFPRGISLPDTFVINFPISIGPDDSDDEDFFNTTPSTTIFLIGTVEFGDDYAYFRNTDCFNNATGLFGSDGIHDGYFATMNYNFDWSIYNSGVTSDLLLTAGAIKGAGLFTYRNDSFAPDGIVSDLIPLFTGIPAGSPGNIASVGDADYPDLVPGPVSSIPVGGMIGDWLNSGVPRPMYQFYDDGQAGFTGWDNIPPFYYEDDIDNSAIFVDFGRSSNWLGYLRGELTDTNAYGIGGIANAYVQDSLAPIVRYEGSTAWIQHSIPNPSEEEDPTQAYGVKLSGTHGDFDHDGDEDVFFATSHDGHVFLTDDQFIPVFEENETYNQLALNSKPLDPNELGTFINASSRIQPNPPQASMYALSGDIDNDGDIDLVVIGGGAPNQLYRNDLYVGPPNLRSATDPPLFYDASQKMIPPLGDLQLGLSLRSSVGDLNSDGLPDIVIANGGVFTEFGDDFRILLNRGAPLMNEGVHVFQPIGSDHPAPFIANNFVYSRDVDGSVSSFEPLVVAGGLKGSVAEPDFYRDVVLGDIDNDGDLDLLSIPSALANNDQDPAVFDTGPKLFTNEDVDAPFTFINSVPDDDDLGDSVLVYDQGRIPELIDYHNVILETVTLKKQGRRARFADVNRDGLLDILTANGFEGSAAPNLLLLNRPSNPGFFDDYTDGAAENTAKLPIGNTATSSGVMDNTVDLAVADFDHDGDLEIIYLNRPNEVTSVATRYLDQDPSPSVSNNWKYVETTGHFRNAGGNPIDFADVVPFAVAIADFDGIGEPTEDLNFNGHLDPGEDTNGNGVLDWTDLPTETEDLNGNGVIDGSEDANLNGILDPGEDLNENGILDLGEDVGVIGPDGELIGVGNGEVDEFDADNNDFITVRRTGVWEGSLDVFFTTEGDFDRLLINDPTNRNAGFFTDRTLTLFPGAGAPTDSRGVDVGDVDLDGDIDIVISINGNAGVRPANLWLNTTINIANGKVRRAVFTNASFEIPLSTAYRFLGDYPDGTGPANFNPWANDVDLADIDGDGDLDMIITGLGPLVQLTPLGSVEMVFLNRIRGEGFNSKTSFNTAGMVSPSVIRVSPRGTTRDVVREVIVDGQNFAGDVRFAFGQGIEVLQISGVDAYDTANQRTVNLLTPPPDLDWKAVGTKGHRAYVTIRVAPDASLGPRNVFVQNASGGATSRSGVFNVFESLPDPIVENGVSDSTWMIYQ
jgi:hypothetical protein